MKTALLFCLVLPAGVALGEDCDADCGGDPVWTDAVWRPLDTLEVFGGYEGFKQPYDFGVNAHNGGRVHLNWAAPLWAEANLGFQAGTALTLTDHAVRVTDQIDGASSTRQSYTTLGVFQRLDSGWSWGAVYDILAQDDYSANVLTQVRGRVARYVTPCDEVGVFGNGPLEGDTGDWAGLPIALDPVAMGAAFWRHQWKKGPETTLWLGVSEGVTRGNVATGDDKRIGERLLYGADVHVPLSDRVALFGEANFITPANAGTVDAYLGFAFYPGRRADGFRRQRFAPLIPAASNPTFVVDGTRR